MPALEFFEAACDGLGVGMKPPGEWEFCGEEAERVGEVGFEVRC